MRPPLEFIERAGFQQFGTRITPIAQISRFDGGKNHVASVSMKQRYGGEFTAWLWKYPGKGGWHFADVPEKFAPPVTHGWGRTPVHATVDGHSWETSVWRAKGGRTVLAIPKWVRGEKEHGDKVRIRIGFNAL